MIKAILRSDKVRYLIAGGWNTLFGYFVGVALFLGLTGIMHTAAIAFIANCMGILMSFSIYKLFVFKTRGNWIREFIKACLVYGNMALVSIVLVWVCVDILQLNIWISQALTLILTVFISYFGHKKFTFVQK